MLPGRLDRVTADRCFTALNLNVLICKMGSEACLRGVMETERHNAGEKALV